MTPGRWIALSALVYGLLHHQGTALSGLGDAAGGTRWADWIDLVTPYAVLLPAAGALRALDADRGAWLLFLLGGISYVEGHGLHLAANSVGNAEPPAGGWPAPVHLWDEVVGHHFLITGVLLVVLAVVRAAEDLPAPPWPAFALAGLVGVTWMTNALEGGAPALGLAGAGLLTWAGWRRRDGFGRVVLAAYAPALALLLGYGAWQRGFPQFTELGWV